MLRRSAFKSTALRLGVSGPGAVVVGACVAGACVAAACGAAAPVAAAPVDVWFGFAAGRAGPLPGLTLGAAFCGSAESGAVPGSCGVRALASRARLERSAFFRASKTMLNTFVPEKPLDCRI